MSPLSRSHGQSTPREPWRFSEEAQEAFLAINKLRYRMLPYLYSTAYETHLYGLPMMRAMILEFENDRNVRNISRQYMLGESLLVAPIFDQKETAISTPVSAWRAEDGLPRRTVWIEFRCIFVRIMRFRCLQRHRCTSRTSRLRD